MKHALVALAVLAPTLAGCVVTEPVPSEPDLCGASAYQYLVGKPGVLLDGMRFSQDVRVIQPGTAVTMDFRADRLNFWLNDLDQIERQSSFAKGDVGGERARARSVVEFHGGHASSLSRRAHARANGR